MEGYKIKIKSTSSDGTNSYLNNGSNLDPIVKKICVLVPVYLPHKKYFSFFSRAIGYPRKETLKNMKTWDGSEPRAVVPTEEMMASENAIEASYEVVR